MNGRQLIDKLMEFSDIDDEVGTTIIVNDGQGKPILKYLQLVGVNMPGPRVKVEGKTILNFTEGFSYDMKRAYEKQIQDLKDELSELRENITNILKVE